MTTDTPTAPAEAQPPLASPEAMDAARSWAMDCDWRECSEYGMDPDELVADMTDAEVKASVEKHYDGGWDAMLRDACLADDQAVEHEAEVEA